MTYKIKKQVLWKTVGDEVVVVDSENENYSYLNMTGKDVWGLIDKGCEVDDIVKELCAKYDATEDQVRKDVMTLVNDLVKAGLIVSK